MLTALSRRRLLAAGSAFAATAFVSRASAQDTATPAASPVAGGLQPDGSWRFTDDRGVIAEAAALPTHIIAQTTAAAALWDFGIRPVGIFGPSRAADGTPDLQAGNLDLDTVEVLGDYGEFDLEKALSLQADLYVDVDRGNGDLWYITPDVEATLLERFPTIAIIAANVPVTTTVAHFEALAAALAADLAAPAVADARTAWQTAEAGFKAAIAAKPGLKMMAVSTGDNQAFVWNPAVLGDLSYYQSLGAEFVAPENPSESTLYNSEIMSWEQFGKYGMQADLILVDQREDLSLYADIDIWNSMPAVQAGQVGTWYGVFPFSYKGLGDTLNRMIEQVQNVNPDLVS
jgi:iron complex transport system substrate-binding protein